MNSALQFENKTAAGEKKKKQFKVSLSVFCFTREAEAKCFAIIIQRIYTHSNSNHIEEPVVFSLTACAILSRDSWGLRTVSSSKDRVPQTVKPPHHQIRRGVVQ